MPNATAFRNWKEGSALQLPAGREFNERDQRLQPVASTTSSSPAVLPIVLNESAARRLFGNENAIGKRVRDDKQSYEVVGVVRDLKNGIGISQSVAYLPLTSRDLARPAAGGITLLVRWDVSPGASPESRSDALTAIRSKITSLDPRLNLFHVQTLSEYLDRSRSSTRFAVQSYGAIGVFGLILAAIGLAGVTGYAAAQRRKEIAIRTAIGATSAQVLRLVLREGTAVVSLGTVLGFLGAMALAKLLSALTSIFVEALKVGTGDLRLLLGAPLLLVAVAMLACYIPARRSTQIDPLQALRGE